MAPTERATVAGGCFWCIEAVFERLRGVESVVSGYCGGHTDDPTYREVCSGTTGHAEAVQITYDPDVVSYEDLLAVFFAVHNPTTKDREGPDVGSQYRSAVFYHDDAQRETVEAFIADIDPEYESDIVTEVAPLETFYEAEEKHQNYFETNPDQAYCRMNIPPKIEKLQTTFGELVAE
jgi:peptide-methionine (S)-S-oxide reductase